jgi:hypothetical protein
MNPYGIAAIAIAAIVVPFSFWFVPRLAHKPERSEPREQRAELPRAEVRK